MRYLETRDIYRVMKELGHTSLKENVKYANLRSSKVAHDFPPYSRTAKNGIMDTDNLDTEPINLESALRKIGT